MIKVLEQINFVVGNGGDQIYAGIFVKAGFGIVRPNAAICRAVSNLFDNGLQFFKESVKPPRHFTNLILGVHHQPFGEITLAFGYVLEAGNGVIDGSGDVF